MLFIERRDCGYHSDLKQPLGESFVLCTDYPYEKSCYQKYMSEKCGIKMDCDFCGGYTETKLEISETESLFYCNDCYEKIKTITFALDSKSKKLDNECVLCHREEYSHRDEHFKNIHGFTVCNECVDKYKLFIMGDIDA